MSKWVEATPIQSKHAFRTASWLHRDILSRWGKPAWVRTDNGAEWQGVFELLLKDWNIGHNHISVGNSKANGLVERTIRTLKGIIRKGLTDDPDSYWSDHLAGALLVLRLSTARAHGYPPFTVVTGLIPVLPSD
jgi:transposase InsO family protein